MLKVNFRFGENGLAHHIAAVSIVAEEGPLAGIEIMNFDVWARTDGRPGLAVSVPSMPRRRDGQGGRRFRIVRDAERGSGAVVRLQRRILAELVRRHPERLTKAAGYEVESHEHEVVAGE